MKEKRIEPKQKPIISTKALASSGITIAVYIVLMYLTQSFSFGQYQMRLATSLYALAAIHPFLILPLGLANLLSNALFGGLGLFDIVGGFIAGALTALSCRYVRKISMWLTGLPILIIPTLLVPAWLSYLLGVPYAALVLSVGIGQIAPAILSVLIVRYLEKPLAKLQEGKK